MAIARPTVRIILGAERRYHRGVWQGINRFARLHRDWIVQGEPSLPASDALLTKPPRPDGVIMFVRTGRELQILRRLGVPFVTLCSALEEEDLPHVSNDGTAIARMALEHFRERSFRHFAFCEINELSYTRGRRFVEVTKDAGFKCHVYRVDYNQRLAWSDGRDREKLATWIGSLPKPVGILACNDLRGRHLIEICAGLGVAVPDEVAVLGVDNELPHCEICQPQLSSVVTDAPRIGFESANLLDQLMAGNVPRKHRILVPPAHIVTRGSSDVTATSDPLVAKAVQFIRARACLGIDVGDVQEHVMLSRTWLDKRFKLALGHSPHQEILRARLKFARELLAETKLGVEMIAERAGFKHAAYMGAVFLREFGQTPGEFRKQSQTI